MSDESDAARILRDREQRRAVERARIDEERTDRRRELGRLRSISDRGVSPSVEETEKMLEHPAPSARAREEATLARPDAMASVSRTVIPPAGRNIGGALRPPILAEFLQTNPMERFNIQALNAQRFPDLIEAARGDSVLLSAITRQAEALMARVKQELDDPLSAGAFLRDQVFLWYQNSPRQEDWSDRMAESWAGLFADSRVSGGRLQPWLNLRLGSVYAQASRSGSLGGRVRQSLRRNRWVESSLSRAPIQQIRAEVAQAILDDLTVRRRDKEGPVPLVRLSELAVRRQVPTINDALAQLFSGPETGPFIILHPNRYPECDEVQIRPPVGNMTGAALAYSLVTGRPGRKLTGRGRGPVETGVGTATEEAEGADSDEAEEVDATTIWTAEEVDAAAWRRVVKERRRERRRLETPPKECHSSTAYAQLRSLLLEDPEFRQSFLSIKWRGRPAGLPLLATLLQKGSLVPEVVTDHEYLEAELGDLARGDPQWHPSDETWTIGAWTVVREGSHEKGFRFTAKRAA
ncbi:MAG TPA: hypothetical protein VEG66_02770 [Thermoplasmata archaeon]|nr:hypothetical protein [Thermoplasmata archaeon]HYB78667.1 hypothetical protein [Thermoplasmata archaeon]